MFACVAQMSAIESDVLLVQQTPLGVLFVLNKLFMQLCSVHLSCCVQRLKKLMVPDVASIVLEQALYCWLNNGSCIARCQSPTQGATHM